MRSRNFKRSALVAVALPWLTEGHTWVESLRNIASNGSFTGPEGFPRGFQSRSDPAFTDVFQTYQIENGHGANPTLCNPHAQGPNSQGTFPRLKATPGSAISLLYQENGHVTLPDTNPGKPANRGTIYIYATQEGKDDEKYFDVYQEWNIAGTGGDKRGKLISTQNYDDGQCFQVNGGKISQDRQASTKFQPSDPMGTNLWCQNNIVIPNDVDASKILSLYWVWKWDTAAGADPNDKIGKNQTYTSCMDVDLQPAASNSKAANQFKYVQGQDVQKQALPNIFEQLKTGNIFVEKDGPQGTAPVATSNAALQPTSSASSLASAIAQSATSVPATGCSAAPAASTQTIFVFGSSIGTVAPTAKGLSYSTAGQGKKTETIVTAKTMTSLTTSYITPAAATPITTAKPVATIPVAGTTTTKLPLVTQIPDGQVQAPGPNTSATATANPASSQAPASAPAAASSGLPVVVPVPADPTGTFTFKPSATSTATASGVQSSAGSVIPTQAPSSATATAAAATSAAPATATGKKCGPEKRVSKIFAPVVAVAPRDEIAAARFHARQWRAD